MYINNLTNFIAHTFCLLKIYSNILFKKIGDQMLVSNLDHLNLSVRNFEETVNPAEDFETEFDDE